MDDPTAREYFSSVAAHDSVRRDRAALERVVAGARRRPIDMPALLAIPSARSAPELAAVAAGASISDSTRQSIVPIAGRLLTRLRASQRLLATQVADARRVLRTIPWRTLEEARLRSDVATRDSLYDALKARVDNLHMAQQRTVATANVLDSAVASPRPTADTRPYLFIATLLVALALAIGVALIVDRIDPKLRYPEQVGNLGLHLLAAVPHMESGREIDHSSAGAARAVEVFRSLRLNLRHQLPGAGGIQLTITSPGASEGKSLLAANLALSFAEAGYRTLLVDGDIRRGKQHETFGTTAQPGLTDFLAGQARADAIARRSTHPNLLVIPCGSRIGRGPELLMSPQLPRLLTAVHPLFDAIIVDSAPLGAGADALALGAATGNVLLVLRSGATERRMAQSRFALLRHAPIRVLGAVLNDIGSAGVYDEYSYIDGYYIPMARTPDAGETLPAHVQVQTQGD
jgi:capsular exopolysaccharide synthesis family protein